MRIDHSKYLDHHSALGLIKEDKAKRHPHWTFDVKRSMFDVHKFLFFIVMAVYCRRLV